MRTLGVTTAAILLALPQIAAAPVTQIAVYVTPYYTASTSPAGHPQVAVDRDIDALLASNRREDIAAAQKAVIARPDLITPMTLMVLAIRSYDVGLKDDSVFWFYVAKNRYLTLHDVLDTSASEFGDVDETIAAFATLAGPVINGYAFCDLARQKQAEVAALDWVEKHPYKAVFLANLPAKPGNRQDNLKGSIARLRAGYRREQTALADPQALAKLKIARRQNDADAKYCGSAR
jgi:hypothetical protein